MPNESYHRLTGDEKRVMRWTLDPLMAEPHPESPAPSPARLAYLIRVLVRWKGYRAGVERRCQNRIAEAGRWRSQFV